jgi:serine/threonine-protein kinase
LIGTTLGAYTVQALLGQGGMATVYQGFDPQLQRPVAIKLLAPALAADPTYVARFRQEARLIASLRHLHIAQVYAFGEHQGLPYMVQELLPGPTLEQRLNDLTAQGEPMPQREVLDTIAQLASALDAAHALGVIHRDVKPSNVIQGVQGQLVLADFGIAHTADASRAATTAGVILGTPSYMAPEQALGSTALTPACDVYALGIVLFELLTGQTPFRDDSAMGVVLKHLNDPPPAPSSIRPTLPPALDAVVLRALDKEPAARFASAGELAQALAAAWPPAPAPGAAPAPSSIHEQQTAVWTRPDVTKASPTAATTPVPQLAAKVQPSPPAPRAAAPVAPQASPDGRSKLLLPLALLLIAVLGAGAVLVARGGAASPEPSLHQATSLPAATAETLPGQAPILPAATATLPTQGGGDDATAAPVAPVEPPAAGDGKSDGKGKDKGDGKGKDDDKGKGKGKGKDNH